MNNNVVALSTGVPLTMSTQEIARLVGKNHFHVLRDAQRTLEGLGQDASKFGGIYSDAYGREKPCLNLPKRETLILVSGYSVQMRAAIIDRWQELEAAKPPELSRMQLIQIAMQSEQERLALAGEVKELTPKAQVYDQIANAEGKY
ncbi:Rha family transcriptional regulator [Candidimonas nitroreducens]|uniref:Rha family transcriptional regulator n=1 Tax=Candidimonas nitroreducens TaxID=683354 RepID=A0A225ML04_9BURK|nr:Rha family transcriptional regulator [Candidimonas nitroreducens]OWT61875.1 hypothetical protein CEY11_08565 [Candidimonas nitroreducens]